MEPTITIPLSFTVTIDGKKIKVADLITAEEERQKQQKERLRQMTLAALAGKRGVKLDPADMLPRIEAYTCPRRDA